MICFALCAAAVAATTHPKAETSEEGAPFVVAGDDDLAKSIVDPIQKNTPRLDFQFSAPDKQKSINQFFKLLVNSDIDFAGCLGSPPPGEKLACSYIQHIILMIALSIVILLIFFISALCFLTARWCTCCFKCCCGACKKICCNWCGGREPTKKYSRKTYLAWIGISCFWMVLLALFGVAGYVSSVAQWDYLISVIDSVINMDTIIASKYKKDIFDSSMNSMKTNVTTTFSNVNNKLTGVDLLGTYIQDMKNVTDELLTAFEYFNGKTNLNQTAYYIYHGKLIATKNALATIQPSSLDQPLSGSSFTTQIDSIISSFNKAYNNLQDLSRDGKKNLVDYRSAVKDASGMKLVYALFPWVFVFIAVILGAVALVVRNRKFWWCNWCCGCWMIPLFTIIFVAFFPIFHPLADLCTVIPSSGASANWQEAFSDQRIVKDAGVECFAKKKGSVFKVIDYDMVGKVKDMTNSFNVSQTIPQSTRTQILSTSNYTQHFKSVSSDLKSLENDDIYTAAGGDWTRGNLVKSLATLLDNNITALELQSSVLDSNLTSMTTDVDTLLKVTVIDAVKSLDNCGPVHDGFNPFHTAFCDQLVGSFRRQYICSLAIAWLSIAWCFIVMKNQKRLRKENSAVADSGSSKAPVKKARAPKGNKVAPAGGTNKKTKK